MRHGLMHRSLLLLCLSPLAARAEAPGDDDGEMGRRLQEALRRRGESVHRCYGAALDRDPQAAGELLLQLELGEGGRVRRAEVLKDESSARGLAACLTQTLSAWRLPELSAAPGDRVVFPLVFRPDQAPPPPVVIPPGRAGRPWPGLPPAARGGKGAAATRGERPGADPRALSATVFISPESHPGTQGTLRLLSPGAAPAPPPRALGEARAATTLYVLSGGGRLHSGGGVALELGAGDGVLLLPGTRYALSGALRLVQFAAATPPRLPVTPAPQPLLVRGGREQAQAPAQAILGGRGRVRILVDQAAGRSAGLPEGAGRLPVSLEELTCEAGVEIPVHQHDESDELLYIVSGRGVMSAGAERDLPVRAGDAVRVPRGVPHGLLVTERLVAIQSYAPSGPEERFRHPPSRAAPSPSPSPSSSSPPPAAPSPSPSPALGQ